MTTLHETAYPHLKPDLTERELAELYTPTEAERVLVAGGECLGVDLPPGVFHGLVVLEADSLMFECKAGPYRPVGEGELAHWAPREGEPGVAEYHSWMRAQFA